MGRRQRNRTNISKRVKTSHKKNTVNRKIEAMKVDKNHKNINHIITRQVEQLNNPTQSQKPHAKIELETISAEQLSRLLSGEKKRQKRAPRINLDETLILEKLMKRWGTDFASMNKDIKLNRMQWTQKQIEKKHEAYKKIVEEEDQQ